MHPPLSSPSTPYMHLKPATSSHNSARLSDHKCSYNLAYKYNTSLKDKIWGGSPSVPSAYGTDEPFQIQQRSLGLGSHTVSSISFSKEGLCCIYSYPKALSKGSSGPRSFFKTTENTYSLVLYQNCMLSLILHGLQNPFHYTTLVMSFTHFKVFIGFPFATG